MDLDAPELGTQGVWAVTATIYDTASERFQAVKWVTFGVPAVITPTIGSVTPGSGATSDLDRDPGHQTHPLLALLAPTLQKLGKYCFRAAKPRLGAPSS